MGNAIPKPEPWEEYLALPDTVMAEFIDGAIYMMAAPTRAHQGVLGRLYYIIQNKIDAKGGDCQVYPAPFGVRLSADKNDTVEPDITVICDKSKLTKEGCTGAPDWIIEIVSPSDPKHDYVDKLKLYLDAGVREYWIVNPMDKTVVVYHLDADPFKMESRTFAERSFTASLKIARKPCCTCWPARLNTLPSCCEVATVLMPSGSRPTSKV